MINLKTVRLIYDDTNHKPNNGKQKACPVKQMPLPKNLNKVLLAVKKTKRVGRQRLIYLTGFSSSMLDRCLRVLECNGTVSRVDARNGREKATVIVFNGEL